MNERFAALPVRALSDRRLSGNDLRVLGAIASFDWFGRNGYGCTVDARKLADRAGVDRRHLSRHASRLVDLGYIVIGRSETDRRKHVYSVVYSDKEAEADDKPPEKVTTAGDNPMKKVTNAKLQVIDSKRVYGRQEISRSDSEKNPAKRPAASDADVPATASRSPPQLAQQKNAAGGTPETQQYFPLPIEGGRERGRKQLRGIDWGGWAKWLAERQGLALDKAWLWITRQIDLIAAEQGIGKEHASQVLDRRLRSRRWRYERQARRVRRGPRTANGSQR